ncbi:MAG: glucose-6-phosphate dehydrogenase assembly protein OpcA [Planctomycetes bacterium]|nr:glucose-6-phosphate dehydrogenase assembly protein OpcA [Planctomycetota bacterium]
MSSATALPAPIPLSKIEQELGQQVREAQGAGEEPVQRVRMSNLVVYCDDEARATEIAAQVPEIVAVHPARVLLLIGDPSGPDGPVTATTSVCCHRLRADRQACSEVVTLRAGGSAVETLHFAARSLVIGDLPMNLWWAGKEPPGLAGTLLYNLAENAQQIIYDSIGWVDPAHGVSTTAAWLEHAERTTASRWRVASDLNWRRLKYWRRLLSQALDPGSAPGAAEAVSVVVVEHGPHAVVQAWELISWLAQQLDWSVQTGKVQPNVEIDWDFASPTRPVRVRVRRLESGPPWIHLVRLESQLSDKPAALNVLRESEERLSITLEGVPSEPRTMTIPPQSPAELVGRQLSDRERDPVFRDSMAVARLLAETLFSY